jgi:NADPH:quinone reductase-like Zn-dependent oxidoreductase
MKAVIINEFGDVNQLQLVDLPKPSVGEGEVLIRIKAAGVNPVDWKIRKGLLATRGLPHQFPLILGWDGAGIIEETGFSARRFKVGDAVYAYCRRPVIQKGTYAEYIALPESYVADKPKNISFEEAAAVPLAALTAYQSVYATANIQKGENILILGASGGVGSFAVQFAKLVGAKVFALASEKNHAYLKDLGADETIDYKIGDFCTALKKIAPEGMDVVFDCFGGESLQHAHHCLKNGGKLVSICSPTGNADLLAQKNAQFYYVFVEPNVPQLQHIQSLIESTQLKIHVSEIYPLEEVATVHTKSEFLHTTGKIVLKIE